MARRKPGHRSHRALKAVAAIILALIATDAWAAELYKLTGRDGRVTYSDIVPRDFDGAVVQRRPDTAQEDRARAARVRVEAARGALEEAQNNSTPDDWIYFPPGRNPLGMRRAPKPEYQERLARLEFELRQAEAELRIAERG